MFLQPLTPLFSPGAFRNASERKRQRDDRQHVQRQRLLDQIDERKVGPLTGRMNLAEKE
jgi:hypothetical protein